MTESETGSAPNAPNQRLGRATALFVALLFLAFVISPSGRGGMGVTGNSSEEATVDFILLVLAAFLLAYFVIFPNPAPRQVPRYSGLLPPLPTPGPGFEFIVGEAFRISTPVRLHERPTSQAPHTTVPAGAVLRLLDRSADPVTGTHWYEVAVQPAGDPEAPSGGHVSEISLKQPLDPAV